jgi:hypothetical protein
MADRGPVSKFNECAENKTKIECAAQMALDAIKPDEPRRSTAAHSTMGVRG